MCWSITSWVSKDTLGFQTRNQAYYRTQLQIENYTVLQLRVVDDI